MTTDTIGQLEKLMEIVSRAGRPTGDDPTKPHERVLTMAPALLFLLAGIAAVVAAAADWPVTAYADDLREAAAICILIGVFSYWRARDHGFWVPSVQTIFAQRAEVTDLRAEVAELKVQQTELLLEFRKTQALLLSRLGAEDAVDPKYLADMSEAVRLGEELAKRKLWPPDPTIN